MKQKIFICGGHVTPAIALISELSRDPSIEIVFIGRKHAMEGRNEVSAEYSLVTEKGIRFLPLHAGRLQRTFSRYTIPSLLRVPVGLVEAMVYMFRERPDAVVSFGGYVAFPIAIAAWFSGVPVITHEQTIVPGLTNRLIGRIARRVCLTFPETKKYFPAEKSVVTGLPLREELLVQQGNPEYMKLDSTYPLIYITGGSQGAHSLNLRLFPAVPKLVKSYTLIHQTGQVSYEEALRVQRSLRGKARNRYVVETYISGAKLTWILQHATIVIGRSGANTIMECAALGKVAVLIPLPKSAGNEQLLHARWLGKHSAAEVIEQEKLTPQNIIRTIHNIQKRYAALQKRSLDFSGEIPRNGAIRLAKELRTILSSSA